MTSGYLPAVEAARAAVFETIGRNVLRFQRLELLLKNALRFTDLRITDVALDNGYQLPGIAESRETLGTLASKTYQTLVVPLLAGAADDPPAPLPDDARMQFKFTVRRHLPAEVHEEAKARLKRLVDERNELVHLSLLRFDFQTASGCAEALAQLEQQAITLKAEIETFLEVNKMIDQLIRYLKSPTAAKELWEAHLESAPHPNAQLDSSYTYVPPQSQSR